MSVPKVLLLFVCLVAARAQTTSSTTGRGWSDATTLIVAHQERGLLRLGFDPSKPSGESLHLVDSTHAGYKPGWLCVKDDTLYSVSRTEYPNANSSSGGVFAFMKITENQNLLSTGNVSSNGEGGVYCEVSPDGRLLSVANIDGSTVSLHSRATNGRLGEAFSVHRYNITSVGPGGAAQNQSNPHQAIFDPSGRFLFVCDRGADSIYVHRVSEKDPLSKHKTVTVLPGTGPRHIAFLTVGTRSLMFLVGELDNAVHVFTVGNQGSRGEPNVKRIQIISTLGNGSDRTPPDGQHLAAEVAVSNDNRFVYVSNRNTVNFTSDTLAIFRFDSTAEEPLVYVGQSETGGKIPRHFSLSPDAGNRYVAVANEVSNNVMVFARNTETGFLGDVVGNFTLGPFDVTTELGPMAVIWG